MNENLEIVHALCRQDIENADAINRRLTARYNEQRREAAANAQRFSRERAEMMNKIQQYRVDIQKQSDEVQRLNGEVTRLEQLLETANSDARNLLSRAELRQTLDDIHTAANSFMSHLKTKMDENEAKMDENGNAHNFGELPGIDVTGDWLDIEAFDVNNHSEAFAETDGTMFPATNPDGVSNI
jgi:predicted RNase H-like nuclease (RuvC/YqgF family)